MTNSEALPRTAVPAGIIDPVTSARAELKAALAAIEIKGNIPRRVEKASTRAVAKARVYADRNPVGAIAATVGIAAAVGGVVWAIARAIAR
ncbi:MULTISPECIES: hypothetical protein [Microbacterium]|jgi:ElaB/YqjD/DUF883 family membrane-anchored ribosome-binding protein|uniref:DUF3618 domain-containing protein n=1 Tax=Microbacterium algeriense TaxID=2615184 RepID=A0ABQ6VEM3_9MICO|nr:MULTISPECIES: hypothetical protein [Microbacterium]AZH80003.1 hypothetical protein CSX12_16900 [Microbacterium sp. Y-01]KAB1866759.1 hypothetical protein F6A08_02800 [Microbacterium algeriense]MDX2400450.1 hypothetical protein [Microbacterium algeriense]